MILTRLSIGSTLLSRMAATFSSRPISLRLFSCSTGTSRYRKTDWRAITRRSVTLDSWKMTSDVRPSLKLAFSLLSLKFSNGSTATDLVLAAGETDFGTNQYRAQSPQRAEGRQPRCALSWRAIGIDSVPRRRWKGFVCQLGLPAADLLSTCATELGVRRDSAGVSRDPSAAASQGGRRETAGHL